MIHLKRNGRVLQHSGRVLQRVGQASGREMVAVGITGWHTLFREPDPPLLFINSRGALFASGSAVNNVVRHLVLQIVGQSLYCR